MSQPDPIADRPDRELTSAAIKRARTNFAAGQGVEHAVVSGWLAIWGKPGRLSCRDWLHSWDG